MPRRGPPGAWGDPGSGVRASGGNPVDPVRSHGSLPGVCCASGLAQQGADGLGILQFTAAHELFHCVQFATWPDLLAEYDQHNWWVEGTAETVVQAVFPNIEFAFREGNRFAVRIRDTPLTRLTYENLVFFSRVWAEDPKLLF